MNISIKNLWRWISWIILWIAGYLLAIQLIQQWQKFDSSLLQFRWHYTFLAWFGFILVILWWGLVWYLLIPKTERIKITIPQVFYLHIWSWLARYIPGKVTSIFGKIALAQSYGIPKRTLVIAGMYEQILQISTALVVGTVLSLSAWSLALSIPLALMILLVTIGLIAIFCHPRVFYFIANGALKIFKRDQLQPESVLSYPKLIFFALLYTVGHLTNGISFFVLTKSLYPVENLTVFPLTGFYLLAGVIGMLAIIVPSGLGVREGVLIGLLTQFVSLPIATAVAIMARLVTSLADAILGLILLIMRMFQRWKDQVLVWIVLFFVTTIILVIPFWYQSSFIDEYWHIFAGREFWQTGELASLYSTGPYQRGMLISIFSGLLQTLFGEIYWVQKIIPISFSLVTMIGIWLLSKKLWLNHSVMISLSLLIWALNPWLLFNHQYLRFYVWYELILVWGVLGVVWLHTQTTKKWLLGNLLILFLLGLSYLIAFDAAVLFPILGVIVSLGISWVTYQGSFEMKRSRRILIIGILGFGILVSDWGRQTIFQLQNQDFVFATPEKYEEFFLGRNLIVSILAILGGLLWLIKGTFIQRIILVMVIILISIHFISSPDIQLIRGIMYLLPFIYFLSLAPIKEFLSLRNKKLGNVLGVICISLLVLGVYLSYPLKEGYLGNKNLMIPDEINPIDYQETYSWVQKNCQDLAIFETSATPFIAEWYKVSLSGVIITRTDWLETDTIFEPTDAGYQVHYNQVPVLTDISQLPNNFCWIQRMPSLDNYLSSETQTVEAEITDFLGIRVLKRTKSENID